MSAPTEPVQHPDGPFPAGFVWGAATSAYQIEGSHDADGKGESIWDRFVRLPGRVVDGSTGDLACDHYRRYRADVRLMGRLGLGAYRFSVAWTRVLPSGVGHVNRAGLDFYDRLVDELLAAGIAPWVTLYHWDLPQALEDRGGWPARETAAAFVAFADAVTRRLGDRVGHWMTVNEPWEIGFLGYGLGVHAPGRSDLTAALAAIHTVLLAHGRAVEVIRTNAPGARVGLALDLVECYPDRDNPGDRAAAARMDGHFNRWFLEPLAGRGYPVDMADLYGRAVPDVHAGDLRAISTPLDFVGLNYYYSNWVRSGRGSSMIERRLSARITAPHTDALTGMGWAVHPEGFGAALARLARAFPAREIVVTESGAAYPDRRLSGGRINDGERIRYHLGYLRALQDAISEGVPIGGYFAWSLLDNFEWQQGYGPRFGLIAVDAATQRRRMKASALWFRRVVSRNALDVPT